MGVTDVTVQWCIISESLDNGAHEKGVHGFGSLVRTNGKVTFHHTLYAHNRSRCPRPGTYGEGSILFDFRNNVIYDGRGYSAEDPLRINYVGNYIRRPNGIGYTVGGEATKMFQAGNFQDNAGPMNSDFWQLIAKVQPGNKRSRPFKVAPVETHSAQEAYQAVLEFAGATLPKRDVVDLRIVKQVRAGTGKMIDSQTEVSGWSHYRSATAPQDSDNGGMPDAWEIEHGLNSHKDDHLDDRDGDGYPNLEEYLNQISV